MRNVHNKLFKYNITLINIHIFCLSPVEKEQKKDDHLQDSNLENAHKPRSNARQAEQEQCEILRSEI